MTQSFEGSETIDKLSQLATTAITSPVKEDRERAAAELRFLSNFESWELLKEIFPLVQNNYLQFLLTKCFLFIVKNELGTVERQETFSMMIAYLVSHGPNENSPLPKFVRMGVYSVIASAFYSNWKLSLMVLPSGHDSEQSYEDSSPHMSLSDLVIQVQKLPVLYKVECLREILIFQCYQITKEHVFALAKNSSIHVVLPILMEQLAEQVSYFPELVLEVCVSVLSTVFTEEGGMQTNFTPKYSKKFTSYLDSWRSSKSNLTACSNINSSVSYHNTSGYSRNPSGHDGFDWKNWDSPLRTLIAYCMRAFTLAEGSDEARQHAGFFLQICASIDPQEQIGPLNHSFISDCLELSRRLLEKALEDAVADPALKNSDGAFLALSIINSGLKHSCSSVIQFLEVTPDTISWCSKLFDFVQSCDSSEQEELYSSLLKYFSDLCSLLPPAEKLECTNLANNALRKSAGNEEGEREDFMEKRKMEEGVLSPSLCKIVIMHATYVVTSALERVLKYSYLQGDFSEAALNEGMSLYNERALEPIAELLFAQEDLFFYILEGKLEETIHYYVFFRDMTAKIKNVQSWNGQGSPWGPEVDSVMSSFLLLSPPSLSTSIWMGCSTNGNSFLESLQIGGGVHAVDQQVRRNILFCLSRLSAAIFIFGMGIRSGKIPHSKNVLQYVISFSSPLLDNDNTLTETLMENLSVGDSCKGDGNSIQDDQAQQLHFGIIRSLFFFCTCIFKSHVNAEEGQLLSGIMMSLLRFVFLYHSDQPSLVHNANSLLDCLLSDSFYANSCLTSDSMMPVLLAVRESRIELLQRSFLASCEAVCVQGGSNAGGKHSGKKYIEECRRARFSFLKNIVVLIERRFYSGYTVLDILERLVSNQLTPEGLELYPVESLGNLLAITSGCTQPDTFFAVINIVLHSINAVGLAIRRAVIHPSAPRLITQWCANVATRSSQFESECVRSYFTYEVLTFLMHAHLTYFQWLSSDGTNWCVSGEKHERFGKARGSTDDDGTHLLFGMEESSQVSVASGSTFGAEDVICNRFRFSNGVVDVDCLYDMFDLLERMTVGDWCNLGVVAHYDQLTLKSFLNGLAQAFLSTSPEVLMSDIKRRWKLFRVLFQTVEKTYSTLGFLFSQWMEEGIFDQILEHTVKCLRYSFLPIIISLILSVLQYQDVYERQYAAREGNNVGGVRCIRSKVLVKTFQEVLFVILTAPYLELSETNNCFRVLFRVYRQAEEDVHRLLSNLLDHCSAYHRVRIRLIMSSLKGDEGNCTETYCNYFGQHSKVVVLTPW